MKNFSCRIFFIATFVVIILNIACNTCPNTYIVALGILTAFARAAGFNWANWNRMVERALPQFSQDGSKVQELPFKDYDEV